MDVATHMADEYALSHKDKFNVKSQQIFPKGNVNSKPVNHNRNYEGQSSSTSMEKSQSSVHKSKITTLLDLSATNFVPIVRK